MLHELVFGNSHESDPALFLGICWRISIRQEAYMYLRKHQLQPLVSCF